MPTPYAALRAALTADPSRPLITWLGPEGRTELSVRTFENGAAKAAGLLRDGLDVQPGDTVLLLLPAHWQTAIWLGACWATGAVASFDPTDVDEAVVALATADRLGEAGAAPEVLRVTRHPLGLPSSEPLPPGVLEAATEVRAYSDVFTPYAQPAGTDPALRVAGATIGGEAVMTGASDLADRCGLIAGGRLLWTDEAVDLDTALALLAVPLAAHASVVIAPGLSPTAETLAPELITARFEGACPPQGR